MFERIDYSRALDILHGRRMTELPSLKFSLQIREKAEYLRQETTVIVRFPPEMIVYDRTDYPLASGIHLISGGTPLLLRAYLKTLPPGKHILKSSSLAREDLPGSVNPIVRNSFCSYTAPPGVSGNFSCPEVLSGPISDDFGPLLEEVHYGPTDLAGLIEQEGEFLYILKDGKPAACCVIYPNYGEIWEIGAVSVDPSCRRMGLGKKIVQHGAALLLEKKRFVRYQMNKRNSASIGLAESAGFVPFMEYNHFEVTLTGERL